MKTKTIQQVKNMKPETIDETCKQPAGSFKKFVEKKRGTLKISNNSVKHESKQRAKPLGNLESLLSEEFALKTARC